MRNAPQLDQPELESPHGRRTAAMRIAVVGVGQALLGDDAAGLAVCRRLEQLASHRMPEPALGASHGPAETGPTLLILPAGAAPENSSARLRRFAPDWVVLVDAARMGAPPGTLAWIPWESTDGVGGSTHSLPLRLLCEYLTASLGCRVDLLGIQPEDTTLGAPLSPAVKSAVERAAHSLAELLDPALAADARCLPHPPRTPDSILSIGPPEVDV